MKRSILVLLSLLCIALLCACGGPASNETTPPTDDQTTVCAHTFGSWVVEKEPNACVEGAKSRTCQLCGETEQQTISAVATHTEVIDPAVAATCTAEGKTEGKHCSVCNAVLKAQTSIPAKGHTEVTDPAVAATCTAEGKTEGKHCSVCNAVLKAQTSIPAKGHTEVTDPAVAATCTTDGKTEGKHCSVCNTVLTAQAVIPAKGHTEVTDPAVAATCTTDGKTEGKHCSVCNTVLKAQTSIPAKGHTVITDPAVAATCTTDGKTEGRHCSVCNAVLTAQAVIPAKGHTVRTLPGRPATCTQTGLTDGKQCTVCHTVLAEKTAIPTTPHIPVPWGGQAPTCTTHGFTVGKICQVCETVLEDMLYLEPTGHKPVSVKGSLPTAATSGLTDGEKCEVCQEILVAQKVIPAGTHHVDISFPGGYITSEAITITTDHLEFHIPASVFVPDDLVENANIITKAIEAVTGLRFTGIPEYACGKVPVEIIRHPGTESGPAYASFYGVTMCPADLIEYSALIHECSHMIQFRQSGWAYEQIAMEGFSTYTEYKVRAYIAENYPDLLQQTQIPEYTFDNYTLSYDALYAHPVEYWFENILTESNNANYSIGLRFMRYLEVVYGSYTKWFLTYQQHNPYLFQSSDSLPLEEELKAFKLAYGKDVFDGFYPWLRQSEDWFRDPHAIEEPLDETAIKKVQLYPYWTNDTFHDCTLTASAYYAEYEDLYVDFDAARYYIGTYKGKNADGLSLSARFMGMLYFYDAQGNLLRVATSEDIGHDWEFDLSGVSFVKLGGKVAVRFFWLEGF